MSCLIVSKHKRITAGILVMFIFFTMLFSAFCIAAEADHDCTGEDCPICACIQQCENTLHQIGDGIALQAAVIIPVIFIFLCISLFTLGLPRETPVSGKVRLNN